MNYVDKQNKVLDFFVKFVENFICKDLEILAAVEPDKVTGLGGCTIPTAMTIISSIDFLGFLLDKNGNTSESKKNISYLFNYTVSGVELFPSYYDDTVIEKIANYRHGMMHHFFPKFKGKYAGICKDSISNDIIVRHSINGFLEESLNVSVLCQDFLNAVRKVKNYLENVPHEEVLDSIIKGLKNLDYSLEVYPQTTAMTTINPGTPKNK